MSLLAGTIYDPSTAVSASTASLLAMTALDTTNLRLTFTVPANGTVLVRLAGTVTGATTFPLIMLGVLEGATLRGRQIPAGARVTALATDYMSQEAVYTVSGLTPGASLTWDAAYGVEAVVASTNLKYGGPNNTTGNDAWGGFQFEIWDTIDLLAGVMYDPTGGAFVAKSGSALLAMTALDTTNLRCTFKAPASGNVFWHLRVPFRRSGAVWGQILLGVLDGATVKARVAPVCGGQIVNTASYATSADASGVIKGLTSGTTYNYDAAYGIETIASTNAGTVVYGGPNNNTTATDAYGGAAFEIWAA